MPLAAVIFDMDGVISDTQDLHTYADSVVMPRYGITVDPKRLYEQFAGVPDKELYAKVLGEHGIADKTEEAVKAKWVIMEKHLQGRIVPMPGVIKLINELRGDPALKIAVASSSISWFIDRVLSTLELKDKFDCITSVDEVKQGKPHPDIFLLTAHKLNVKPEECVVIEDAPMGMRAAKRANMKCVGLVKEEHMATDNPQSYPADILISSLCSLSLERLRALLSDKKKL